MQKKRSKLWRLLFTYIALVVFCASYNSLGENAGDYSEQISYSSHLSLLKPEAEKPSASAYRSALIGYYKLSNSNRLFNPILTIVDFTLPSTKKRLFVIDLKRGKVLLNTYVSHGINSGENLTDKFSNQKGSNMSSPGFYLTGSTYFGKHGLSLNLHGKEEGINDNALDRAIIVHGADYCNEDFIAKHGRLGRSQGCPAVPIKDASLLINLIKDGSCFFIYTAKDNYLKSSRILNGS